MSKDKSPKKRTPRVPTELQGMVERIEPAALTKRLTHTQEVSLKAICDAFRPDAPLICLFGGECTADKNIAAEVLANELDLDLFRVDLSAVVTKYIGETEKNLGRIFDAAEEGSWILFFDEADALFGSRTDVKDSHDRYANIEINYLLQRLEGFRGPVIFATNLKRHIDAPLLRRLSHVIDFPSSS